MSENEPPGFADTSADVNIQQRLSNTALALCLCVVAFGLCVMLGWWFHVPMLKGFIPGGITAKGNTGLCFVLLGLALWATNQRRRLLREIVVLACLSVCGIGGISLTEHLTGWNLRVDDLLFRAGPEDWFGSTRPALMAAITAFSFVSLAMGVWLLDLRQPILVWCSQGLTCAAFIAAIVGVLDPVLDPWTTHTHMSPLTSVMLVMFSVATLFSRPERGLGALFASSTSGGTLARRLLPAAILVPIVVGYLRWKAVHTGVFSEWMGISLMIVVPLVLLATLILWTAHLLDDADRKQRREQEKSSRMASIVTSSNEAIIGKTLDGTVISWNRAAETMYGYTAEEMIGRSISTTVPRDRMREYEEVLARLRTGEQVRHFESERIRKNGRRFPVSVAVAPIRDAAGNLTGAATVARDITEEKEAEQKLQRQAALLDLANDAILVRDLQSRILYWNRGAEAAYGYTSQEASGKVTHQLLRTEFPIPFATIERLIRENKAWEGELLHYTRDGIPISVASRWSLMCDDRGEPSAILEINRDITERKRAEAALRAERQKFNSILNAVPPYVCLLTADYQVAFANHEFKQRFGEAPGLRCYEALFDRTEGCETCETYKVLKDGQSRRWEWLGPDGRNYDVYDFPFTDTDGSKLILEMGIDITERKRAEAAAMAERQRFEAVLESLPALICLITPDHEVAFANKAFRDRFGEAKRRKCYEYIFGHSAPCTFCEAFQVLDTKLPHDWECPAPEKRVLHVYNMPFTDVDGSPLILEMNIDVTEQRRAEEEIRTLNRELEDRVRNRTAELQTVLDTAPIGLAITNDPEAAHIVGNAAIEQMLGGSHGAELSKGGPNCVPYRLFRDGRELPVAELPMQRAARGEAVTGELMEILRPDGTTITSYCSAAPILDERHQAGGAVGAFVDITDQKRSERELKERTEELRQNQQRLIESEQRVRNKLDAILSPEGDQAQLELADVLDVPALQSLLEDFSELFHVTLGVVDLHGRVLAVSGWQKICRDFHRANPESCTNCLESDVELSAGVPAGEFKIYKCKNNMWDVATPIVVGNRQVGNLYLGQILFEDEPTDYEAFRQQAKRYVFDEKEYWAALESVPRLDRQVVNSSMAFLSKFAQVLSQLSYSGIKLARSSAQLGRLNAQLDASNKELEAFSYSVSHDLRAPLRHISGFSRILTEEFGPQLPEDAQHHLHRIQEGTRRMGQLIDDLLNLGRVGRHELRRQATSLEDIVHQVLIDLEPECEGRNIEWKVGSLPFVDSDGALLKQVFQNLLLNALKFTRPCKQAEIEIGCAQQEGVPVIFVRDNGVGFNMKYATKLFGVFQRMHRAEDFEGTGVGLATVQRIVQKHGGRVWAEAELNQGATFYFTLAASDKALQETATKEEVVHELAGD